MPDAVLTTPVAMPDAKVASGLETLQAAWMPGHGDEDGRLFVWVWRDPGAARPDGADPDTVARLLERHAEIQTVPHGPVTISVPRNGAVAKGPRPSRPTTVSGVTLSPLECLHVLPRLPPPRVGHTAWVGQSLAAWAQAARFALELLVRQRYVPQLERRGGTALAAWRPVYSDPQDASRANALAAGLPGVALAFADDRPARALLDDYLAAMVDAGVRAACARSRLEGTTPPEGIGRRWAAALFAADGRIGKAGAYEKLGRLLTEWAAPAQAQATWRTVIRLDAPPIPDAEGVVAPSDDWRLAYGLQSIDDPSLVVPADAIWGATGSGPEMVRWGPAEPEEALLSGLGVAARIWDVIARSLDQARPAGADLTPTDAEVFVREVAPRLADVGLAAQVPGVKPLQSALAARLRARSKTEQVASEGPARFGLESILEFDVRLALAGREVTPAEWETLLAMKAPLVRVRGQWISLRPGELEAARRLWQHRQRLSLKNALLVAAEGELEGFTVETVEAGGWLAALFGKPGPAADEAPPKGLQATLRPYQARGVAWLATMRRMGLGALLADDMGLGKTLQVLACELGARNGTAAKRPSLVVCPASVVTNWAQETARFTPGLRVLVHHGPQRSRDRAFERAARGHDVVVTTYALMLRDQEALGRVHWSAVVLDEAQYIKNAASKQARAARSLKADWRAALTGTPVENRLAELWSILHILNPGFLGPYAEFRRRYATPIERYGDPEASAKLSRLIRPFLLRRVKTDPTVAGDLPEKIENTAYVPLTREQASLYEGIVRDAMARIQDSEGIERRGIIVAMLTRLKQVCNHPAHFLADGSSLPRRSGKLERLTELLEEALEEGDGCLIFTQFREMGELLVQHLEPRFGRILWLHGGVPRTERDRMVAAFQSGEGPRIFLLSLRAAGTGLNLTAANRVFHFDRWWNPAVEDQATDRAHRIGQKRSVQVHKFVATGTIEEKIHAALTEKRALADRIVGAGEAWVTELSNSELRQLLALRPGSVEDAA